MHIALRSFPSALLNISIRSWYLISLLVLLFPFDQNLNPITSYWFVIESSCCQYFRNFILWIYKSALTKATLVEGLVEEAIVDGEKKWECV